MPGVGVARPAPPPADYTFWGFANHAAQMRFVVILVLIALVLVWAVSQWVAAQEKCDG